jgi:sigma-E factor negative regulatory protein RseC
MPETAACPLNGSAVRFLPLIKSKENLKLATEQGVVTKVGIGTAWIKTTKSDACKGCSARNSCHSMGGEEAEVEVEVVNAVNAQPGDRVVISFETTSLLKATFLIYVFPIVCLLAGALVGRELSPLLDWGESTAAGVIGFSAFFVSMLFVYYKANRMAKKDQYRPRVLRIIGPHVPESECTSAG